MNNEITIDVRGNTFLTTFDIASKSPLLKSLLEEGIGSVIKIDRDPQAIPHVLNFLIHPEYPYPKEYLSELDFFGIKHAFSQVITDLQNENNSLKERIKILEPHWCNQCFKYGEGPQHCIGCGRISI